MKTALGGGSQHREKDVNDSRGKNINNAGLPLSLHPNATPLPKSSASTLLYICNFILSIYCVQTCVVLSFVKSLT